MFEGNAIPPQENTGLAVFRFHTADPLMAHWLGDPSAGGSWTGTESDQIASKADGLFTPLTLPNLDPESAAPLSRLVTAVRR